MDGLPALLIDLQSTNQVSRNAAERQIRLLGESTNDVMLPSFLQGFLSQYLPSAAPTSLPVSGVYLLLLFFYSTVSSQNLASLLQSSSDASVKSAASSAMLVQHMASILFKNTVKQRWAPQNNILPQLSPEKQRAGHPHAGAHSHGHAHVHGNGAEPHTAAAAVVDDASKQIVRLIIVPTIAASAIPDALMSQIAQAIGVIADEDHPHAWPQLIPQLAQATLNATKNLEAKATTGQASSEDLTGLRGLLTVADAVFEAHKEVSLTSEFIAELKHVLDQYCPVLMPVLKLLEQIISSTGCVAGCSEARRVCSIILSLTWHELAAYFEDALPGLLNFFGKVLGVRPRQQQLPKGVIEHVTLLQAQVCKVLGFWAERYEDDVSSAIPPFLQAIWVILQESSQLRSQHTDEDPSMEELTSDALAFVTAVAKSGCAEVLKNNPETIAQLVDHVVLPNTVLSEDDIDQAESNPADYIRRELEGSDSGSRRRSAADLLRALVQLNAEGVTGRVLLFVDAQFSQDKDARANANSARLAALECAMFLLGSVGSLGYTYAHGTTRMNELMPVNRYLSSEIVPRLGRMLDGSRARSTYQAAVDVATLRLVHLFRSQIPVDAWSSMIPVLVALLRAPFSVVRAASAITLERVLVLYKSSNAVVVDVPVALECAFQSIGVCLGAGSGGKADLSGTPGEEGVHLSKCLWRILSHEPSAARSFSVHGFGWIVPCLQALSQLLGLLCSSFVQLAAAGSSAGADSAIVHVPPFLVHYLFETTGAILTLVYNHASVLTVASVEIAENSLFAGALQPILQNNVEDLIPYAFQLLAYSASHSAAVASSQGGSTPLSPVVRRLYAPLLTPCVHPSMWTHRSSGATQAVAQFLEACIRVDPDTVFSTVSVEAVLGVVQKLVSMRQSDFRGVLICLAIASTPAGLGRMTPHLTTLFQILFQRLMTHRTSRFAGCVGAFIMWLLYVGLDVPSLLDQLQPQLFTSYILNVFGPSLDFICDDSSLVKVVVAGCACLFSRLVRSSDLASFFLGSQSSAPLSLAVGDGSVIVVAAHSVASAVSSFQGRRTASALKSAVSAVGNDDENSHEYVVGFAVLSSTSVAGSAEHDFVGASVSIESAVSAFGRGLRLVSAGIPAPAWDALASQNPARWCVLYEVLQTHCETGTANVVFGSNDVDLHAKHAQLKAIVDSKRRC
eukprot:ANDGO_04638.mRNA.1 Exportin-2